MSWVATGVILLNLPLSALRSAAYPGAYVPGFAAGVLALLALLTAWSFAACVRGRSADVPLGGIVAISCLALAAHAWTIGPQPVAYPPLLHVLGGGMVISAMVGVRLSLVIIPLFAAGVAVIRAPDLGGGAAALEATLLAVSGLVGAACVDLFQRASRTVNRTVEATWLLAEDSARAARRASERERWDGLVHDKVLGALRIAGRSGGGAVPSAARDLAGQALAAFRGDWDHADSSTAQWRRHAGQLGLHATIDVDGEIPDRDVRDAVVAAAEELLSNVSRHSGQDQVRITGRLGESGQIVVADSGRGFAPGRTPPGTGLATSVIARMRSVGGRAEIRSAPGRGTRVVLRWVPASVTPASEEPEWQLRTFAPMMALGAVVLVINVVRGYGQWSAVATPSVSVLVIAAIVAVTGTATFLRPTASNWRPLVATVAVCVLVPALATPDGAPLDWRYWYLGALTPAIAAIAYRFRPGAGVSTALGAWLTVTAVDMLAGRPFWASLAGTVTVLVATSIGASFMRRGMDDAWRRANDAAREATRIRMAIADEAERERIAATRVAALDAAVGPELRSIAEGGTLSAEQARDLLVLESAVRDYLAAPDLLDGDLVSALAAARARGVVVDVVAREPAAGSRGDGDGAAGFADGDTAGDADGAAAAEPYRVALATLLPAAPPGTRVRVTWDPRGSAGRGTVSAVGENVGLALARVIDHLRERPDLDVSQDEDALLVMLSPVLATPAGRPAPES